jgi:hypothetical protein
MKPRFRTIPLTLFVALLASAAVAQTPASPAPPEHPAIEPGAMEILKATGDKLASAGAMSFTAIATFQYPARNGQPLYCTNEYDVVMRRPDKLRVIMPGDGNASEYYDDGKVMAVYSPAFDLVAFAEAPPIIDAMLKVAEEKAAIFFPFEDVLVSNPTRHYRHNSRQLFISGGRSTLAVR